MRVRVGSRRARATTPAEPITITTAIVTSSATPPLSSGTAPAATGPGGATSITPISRASRTSPTASANGTAAASTTTSERQMTWPRRRARAMPSIVVITTGTSSASTNRDIAQPGTTLPPSSR